jgi:hypothetical protein
MIQPRTRRRLLLVAVAGATVAALTVVPLQCDPVYTECMGRPAVVVSGDQGVSRFGRVGTVTIPDNSTVDARTAVWHVDGAGDWPVVIDASSGERRADVCFVGGTIRSELADTESITWADTWHHTTAIQVQGPRAKVVGVRLDRVGDGIDFQGSGAVDGEVVQAWISDGHDDCIENDQKNNLTVSRSLLDGCYVAFAARGTGPAGRTVRVVDSLVRLKPMRAVFNGPVPGHGPFFKWETGSPGVEITGSVFRVDQYPNHGTLDIPAPAQCSGNTLVWLGPEPVASLPASLLACFATVTTDVAVWDQARAAWIQGWGGQP